MVVQRFLPQEGLLSQIHVSFFPNFIKSDWTQPPLFISMRSPQKRKLNFYCNTTSSAFAKHTYIFEKPPNTVCNNKNVYILHFYNLHYSLCKLYHPTLCSKVVLTYLWTARYYDYDYFVFHPKQSDFMICNMCVTFWIECELLLVSLNSLKYDRGHALSALSGCYSPAC